ncbi:hypothetical protein [Tolypothrix sp. VBCCA 56010]|uniref:hypothetical protein n=1 Tax=Tolypothrix sp. VBCCA 56010 TaxID=3137731 RepID=UPI003D7D79CD
MAFITLAQAAGFSAYILIIAAEIELAALTKQCLDRRRERPSNPPDRNRRLEHTPQYHLLAVHHHQCQN